MPFVGLIGVMAASSWIGLVHMDQPNPWLPTHWNVQRNHKPEELTLRWEGAINPYKTIGWEGFSYQAIPIRRSSSSRHNL